MTISEYLKNAKFVQQNLLVESEKIVLKNEDKLIDLNVDQMQSGEGNDGKELYHIQRKKYTGFYSLTTQNINPKKTILDRYTFFETGDFLLNFNIELSNDLTKVDIFSTGTGSGEKLEFFQGYINMFGLSPKNERDFNYNILLPELQKYIKKYL
jgi:hypothetical protein